MKTLKLKISVFLVFWSWDFEITFAILFFFHMKELVEQVTEIEVRGLKTYPLILKKFLKVQKRFLVHFWTFKNFLKIKG